MFQSCGIKNNSTLGAEHYAHQTFKYVLLLLLLLLLFLLAIPLQGARAHFRPPAVLSYLAPSLHPSLALKLLE